MPSFVGFRVYGAAAVVALLACGYFVVSFTFFHKKGGDDRIQVGRQLGFASALSVLGYVACLKMIPALKGSLLKAGLGGLDIGKRGTKLGEKPVPESLGIVVGTIFLCCVCLTQVFYAQSDGERAEYNAALLSICLTLFMGFVDDVIELKWRWRIVLPALGCLPLLCAYHGGTSITVPGFAGQLLYDSQGDSPTAMGSIVSALGVEIDAGARGGIINLGFYYYIYMWALCLFCTNAINIYAGINGLEAGQSLVIGVAILAMNLIDVLCCEEINTGDDSKQHLFSAMIILPFIATTLGLLKFNAYPSRVFVGDSFTNFAGMTIAVVAILGHFSKSLLLFFIPQLLNFIMSLPQLFHIVPCPRHRIPKYNPETRLLECSTVAKDDPRMNLTLLNLAIRILGPMSEDVLCFRLLVFQAICCAGGVAIRCAIV